MSCGDESNRVDQVGGHRVGLDDGSSVADVRPAAGSSPRPSPVFPNFAITDVRSRIGGSPPSCPIADLDQGHYFEEHAAA
jgi:hypothetical protein